MNEPYRFLRNYDFTNEDREVFRGRNRETAALVTEITTRHLVVLFAPTGTGKSSLINAGVRPALEELGYKTVYVAPKSDIEDSIKQRLEERGLLDRSCKTLGEALRGAVAKANQPLVLFLDQFEEFFLYTAYDPDKAERANYFVKTVAALYRDRACGIHFLFSLREDFFVEMDIFRDEIPTLFQANSSLRLRAFEREPAREAIEGPAAAKEVKYVRDRARPEDEEGNKRFVDRILDDLQEIGPQRRISPIHLQIVCDTLWRDHQNSIIDEPLYDRLGGVRSILAERFRTDFAGNLTDDELLLFEKLLPLLRSSERGTKRVLPINLLPEQLHAEETKTDSLVQRLVSLRLLHQGTHGTIEWASDYLSARLEHLKKNIRCILISRLLARAMERARAAGAHDGESPSGDPETENVIDARYMKLEEFRDVSTSWPYLVPDETQIPADPSQVRLQLSREQVLFLLEAALEHGEFLDLWQGQAAQQRLDIIPLLRHKVIDTSTRMSQIESAIRLLLHLHTKQALEIVRTGLASTSLAPLAVAEMGRSSEREILEVLSAYLQSHVPTPGEAALMSVQWTPAARALLNALPGLSAGQSARSAGPLSNAGSVLDHSQPDSNKVEWQLLLRLLRDGRILPIIGMGTASVQLSRALAAASSYPGESSNLAAVVEYAEWSASRRWVCEFISDFLQQQQVPSHITALAQLPIASYINTGFDNHLVKALQLSNKAPMEEEWAPADYPRRSRTFDREPTPERPLVYHLQGRLDGYSAVLTTTDQFQFIAAVRADSDGIPVLIRAKFARATPILLDFEPGSAELHIIPAVFGNRRQPAPAGYLVAAEAPANSRLRSELLSADSFRLGVKPYSSTASQFTSDLLAQWRSASQ